MSQLDGVAADQFGRLSHSKYVEGDPSFAGSNSAAVPIAVSSALLNSGAIADHRNQK